jgi:hypothetical protein
MSNVPGGVPMYGEPNGSGNEIQIEGFVESYPKNVDPDDIMDLQNFSIKIWNLLQLESIKNIINLNPIELDLLRNRYNWRFFLKLVEGFDCTWVENNNKEFRQLAVKFNKIPSEGNNFAQKYYHDSISIKNKKIEEEQRKVRETEERRRLAIEEEKQRLVEMEKQRLAIEKERSHPLQESEEERKRKQWYHLEEEYRQRKSFLDGSRAGRGRYNKIAHSDGEDYHKLMSLRVFYETPDKKQARLQHESPDEKHTRLVYDARH